MTPNDPQHVSGRGSILKAARAAAQFVRDQGGTVFVDNPDVPAKEQVAEALETMNPAPGSPRVEEVGGKGHNNA